MSKDTTSIDIISLMVFAGLVISLAILSAVNVFMPYPDLMAAQELPASKSLIALVNALVILVVYGGLGFAGLKLSRGLGFAGIWDPAVSNRQRFVIPALAGFFMGVIFIFADRMFSRFHDLGALPHPPFPSSLIASAAAGIGEELIFRLFFISFWVWLVSSVMLKKRGQNPVFWIISICSALAFAAGHLPSAMLITGTGNIADMPPALLAEILVLNSILSVPAAWYLKKYGFLASVGLHFWTDVVWHVAWGMMQ